MSQKKTRRVGVALVALAGLLLLSAGAALAQGPPVVKITERLVNEPTTDIGVHPCTGQPAELTLVESGVIHFRAFADGTVHFTDTLRGTFSVEALPADGIRDATGRFVERFGGNGLLLEEGGAVGKGRGLLHHQRHGHERRESPSVQMIRRNEAPEVTGGDSKRQAPVTRNEGVPGSSPGVGLNPCSEELCEALSTFMRSDGALDRVGSAYLQGFLPPRADACRPHNLGNRPPAVHELEGGGVNTSVSRRSETYGRAPESRRSLFGETRSARK
jgi:hypothetical protein